MIVSSNGQLIYTISSYNKGATTLRLRSNIRSSFTKKQFISIKDILLYNFSIDESFIKIPSNIPCTNILNLPISLLHPFRAFHKFQIFIKKKIKLNFYFHISFLCGVSNGFVKAFKAILFFLLVIGSGKVKNKAMQNFEEKNPRNCIKSCSLTNTVNF